MSIVTMKRQTNATYRTSISKNRQTNPLGIFSTVGTHRPQYSAATRATFAPSITECPNSLVPFAPIQSYDQRIRQCTAFSRRPAPFSVFRPTFQNSRRASDYIYEKRVLEQKRHLLTNETERIHTTNSTITYAEKYELLNAECAPEIVRPESLVCGQLTQTHVCPS